MKIYVYGTGCGAGDLIDAALPAERVEAFVDRAGGGRFLGSLNVALVSFIADRLAEIGIGFQPHFGVGDFVHGIQLVVPD